MNDTAEPAARRPSAIDLKIKDVLRNARYFTAVAAGSGADKSSPEYQAYADQMVSGAIGAAIGLGKLYRSKEASEAAPADAMKALRDDARWLAAAAAQHAGIDKAADGARYQQFSDAIVDSAIATAIANDRLRAPNRSFAEKVIDSRSSGQGEGISV